MQLQSTLPVKSSLPARLGNDAPSDPSLYSESMSAVLWWVRYSVIYASYSVSGEAAEISVAAVGAEAAGAAEVPLS